VMIFGKEYQQKLTKLEAAATRTEAEVAACETDQHVSRSCDPRASSCVDRVSTMSAEARPFVSGGRTHYVRPLSGAGVLNSECCKKYEHLRTQAKVSTRLSVWERELAADHDRDYLLEGISAGFHIIDDAELPPQMCRANYKSTSGDNKCKVECRIKEELVKGNYLLCEEKPLVP
jgi:hypothetical protein